MTRKLRNLLVMLLVSSLFISNIEPITVSASGSDGKTMNTDELVFITLADNTDYRWNANGNGDKSNVIHLDTVKGSNCKFKLKKQLTKMGMYRMTMPIIMESSLSVIPVQTDLPTSKIRVRVKERNFIFGNLTIKR